MREPDETELGGLERLLGWLKNKGCEEITGKECETLRSDECLACLELSGAQEWLQELILDQKENGK